MHESPYAGAPDRPVFVGGCPRSGTTLLRTILNSHPSLAIPHETRYVVDAYRQRERWGDLSERANRVKLAQWIVNRKKSRVERLMPDAQLLVDRMAEAPPTLGSLLSTGFRIYAERRDKPRWGDKRPAYALNLDAVFALYPDAQFINIVRDPRATVASIRKIGWFKDGLVAGTELYERSLRRSQRSAKRLASDQFMQIRYETLAADPLPIVEQMVRFLQLDPAGLDRMMAFHETADIRSKFMHPLVSKPITTQAVRAWEDALTHEEVAFIEQALSGQMRRFGYEPAAAGTAVPAVLRKRLLRRRLKMRRNDAQTLLREQKLRFTYKQPVAARA